MENLRKILDKFFHDEYSRKDYFAIQSQFEKEEADPEFLSELKQQWESVKDEPVSDFHKQTIWNRISTQLHFSNAGKGKVLSAFDILQRVAAILFIPLLLGFFLYYYSASNLTSESAWAEIICPTGVRTQFQLPDGSTGVLNSESTLKYAINFKSNRTLRLQGQAYFDVVKDKTHPFSVNTGNMQVQVLGTSFSVSAYPDEMNEEVVLKTGKVKVKGADEKTIAELTPNQQLIFDKATNSIQKNEVNAASLVSWIQGKLVFKNERLEDVVLRLSRWYHADIELKDNNLKDYKYYGTFENESFDEVLHLLGLTAPIKYQELERMKRTDGTFSNRKIVIQTDEKRINDFK